MAEDFDKLASEFEAVRDQGARRGWLFVLSFALIAATAAAATALFYVFKYLLVG
jgi:hypothetical protein